MTSSTAGLNINNGLSTNANVNVSDLSNKTNLSFENNSDNFIQNQYFIASKESIFELKDNEYLINSFINGNKSNTSINNNTNIDLILSVENNKQNILTESIVQNIKDYKLEMNERIYQKLENKVDMLLGANRNSKKYISVFFKNIADFNRLSNDIEEGIIDKTSKIKNNNFESIFKDFVSSEDNLTRYFSLISNHFVESLSDNKNSNKNSNKFRKVLLDTQPKTNMLLNFANQSFVTKHNLVQFKENTSNEYSNDIRSVINDFNIQNIVTMIRNLYFMSPNTLFENYSDINTRFLNLEEKNLRVLTSELNSLDIFKNINTNNNKVDVESISSSSSLKNKKENIVFDTRNRLVSTTIASLAGIQYLPDVLSDYVDSVMIRDFSENLHIKDNEYGTSELIPPSNVMIAKEINKLFTGNFFDIDLARYDILKTDGITSLLGDIAIGTQNSVVVTFIENYLNNANKEIIYKYNSAITRYSEKQSGSSGSINAVNRFNVDDQSVFYIDDINFKIKIDSLVKKNKIKNLINNDIDLTFANEVVSNIKNSAILNEMIPYCVDDKESISIIDEENVLFNLLFTKEDEEVYSHIDLLTNHKIDNVRFRGADSMKKDDIDVNSDYESIKVNIKKLISNYYPKNSFFSSSNLYRKLIKSVINEAAVSEDVDYEEFNLTQCLYFNFFKKGFSDKVDVKKLVAKRFIKKAIQLDTVSNSMFRNSSLLSFKYNVDNILADDYDNTSKSEIESYLDEILDSSENLKLIKNNVFGLRNINNLNLISDLKRISNPAFANSGNMLIDTNIWEYSLSAIINYNLLPNYCMLYDFSSGDVFKEEGNISFHLDKRNKILEQTTYGEVNEESGEREITSKKYLIDKRNSGFDVTSSESIIVKVTPKLCKSDKNRENHDFPYIIIKDQFDNIFKSVNKESFVFFAIIDSIQDMLRLSIKDFVKLNFNNEDDIDSLISSNESILSDVIELIELFSELYLVYTSRMQRLQAIKIFKWQKKDIDHGLPGRGQNSNFPYNGIISKHSNVYNTFKNVMSLDNNDNIDIITNRQSTDIVKDMSELIDSFDSSKEMFLETIMLEPNQENFKTHITSSMYNILRSLFISDLSQAFTFDLVNGLLDHQEKIISADRDDITSSELFDNIETISEDTIENIESNFYDLFYINKLSKKLLYMKLKNNLNNEYLLQAFDNKSYDYYINKNILQNSKEQKASSINAIGSNIDNTTEISKEIFLGGIETYLNSNFSSFCIKNESVSNKSVNAIIKITVSIVDKFNVNRFYIPKVFLFSPMITNVNYFSPSMLSLANVSIENKNAIIGYFDPNKNISNRINISSIDDLIDDENNFLINVIKDKFNVSESESVLIYKYLVNCHVSSNEISKIMKHVYNIRNETGLYKNEVSEEVYQLAGELTEKQFFNIFDSNKSVIFENVNQNDNGMYNMTAGYNVIQSNNLLYDTLNKLENLSCMSEIEKGLDDIYYDIFNIAVNTDGFYYVDISEDALNLDEIEYETNNINRVFHKILDINDFMLDKTCKKSNLLVDNFNIVFNTEIL